MSSENGEVYIMREAGEEEWVSPTPARAVITDALTEATDLSADDVGPLDEYVDLPDLRAVLDGDESTVTFTVEGHDVTVTDDGDVDVSE